MASPSESNVVPSTGRPRHRLPRRQLAIADAFADVEHRRLVFFTLTDDDHAVHLNDSQAIAHGVDRGLVQRILVAATHPARGGERSRFGDPRHLHRDVAVESAA
jgi:hypothetical protein